MVLEFLSCNFDGTGMGPTLGFDSTYQGMLCTSLLHLNLHKQGIEFYGEISLWFHPFTGSRIGSKGCS